MAGPRVGCGGSGEACKESSAASRVVKIYMYMLYPPAGRRCVCALLVWLAGRGVRVRPHRWPPAPVAAGRAWVPASWLELEMAVARRGDGSGGATMVAVEVAQRR